MLESLCQGVATIHELNLAGAFPERAPYRPRDLYAALKATPLYDPERGQWNGGMSEEQKLLGTDRSARAQLFGVLVEAQFNPVAARALYEKLKATPLYDPECGQWTWSMSRAQEMNFSSRYAVLQVLGVLAEAQFDAVAARERYAKLKTTPFYDPERKQWNRQMSSLRRLCSRNCDSATELLGVLAEAQCTLEGARELYEKLKLTPLYDPERGQWNWTMSEKQELEITKRYVDAQLLGVLVEAEFNPEGAREQYEQLKATPLYDPARRQWNWSISENQYISTDRFAVSQLVGVLVEAKLLSTLPGPLVEAVPPLPVVETW